MTKNQKISNYCVSEQRCCSINFQFPRTKYLSPFGLVKKMFELAPANTNIERIKDGEGQLPLHTALDYQADDEIIKYLIEKYPEGTKKSP